MHPPNDVRPGQDQVLVAPLVFLAAEVGRGQVLALNPRAGRAVHDHDPLGEDLLQRFGALPLAGGGRHGLPHPRIIRDFRTFGRGGRFATRRPRVIKPELSSVPGVSSWKRRRLRGSQSDFSPGVSPGGGNASRRR